MNYLDPLELQKDGVGLVLDLGEDRTISEVELSLSTAGGALELRAAPEGSTEVPVDAGDQIGIDVDACARPSRTRPGPGPDARRTGDDALPAGVVHRAPAVRGRRVQERHRRGSRPRVMTTERTTSRPEDDAEPRASGEGPYAGRTDRELMAQHVAGDADAFGELFHRHRDRLWAVALRTLGNPDDAADALQDAMVSAFRRAASYRGEAAVTTWLHRVVVNACLDRVRREAVRATDPLPEGDHSDRLGQPRDDIAVHVQSLDVAAALATLPYEQRASLVLVDMEGYSIDEAAAILGVASGTIKSRCARGRARLLPLVSHLRGDGDVAGAGSRSGNEPVAGARNQPAASRVARGNRRTTSARGPTRATSPIKQPKEVSAREHGRPAPVHRPLADLAADALTPAEAAPPRRTSVCARTAVGRSTSWSSSRACSPTRRSPRSRPT